MSEREPYYAGTPREEWPAAPVNPVHVVLDNLRSAFNVGSIFRTSDAGGVGHMHLSPHQKILKTSLGAFAYVPWTYYERTSDALDRLHADAIPIVAIEVSPSAISHVVYPWPKPVAVVFGNEVLGIPEKTLAQCDAVVQIPMLGHKNTINVATAFGIILYEILRRWNAL
ncbi:MAG: TrmH family RNA methyltransferase [Candidatus Hydrogenedentes bacterium]|nr:TrmH family RNA methyltransferase [Candidatus Hydrogenedentota bacterium]